MREDWEDVCLRPVEVAHSLGVQLKGLVGVQLEGLVGVTVSGGIKREEGRRGRREGGRLLKTSHIVNRGYLLQALTCWFRLEWLGFWVWFFFMLR